MKRKAAERDKVWEFAWIFLAVIVLVLVIAIRVRLLAIPLERDEGEYAYAGQLLLRGIPPYKLAYNVKFPGTCYLCELNCACARRRLSAAPFNSGLRRSAASNSGMLSRGFPDARRANPRLL